MKILVVGLGSMGQRRIRNLHELGLYDIVGVDQRGDRLTSAATHYGIETVGNLEAVGDNIDAVIVSTSPEAHLEVIEWAVIRGADAFVEASVYDHEKAILVRDLVESSSSIVVPSCTMRYFQGPMRVKELVLSGVLGKPQIVTYHVGQYLPDWHPWEDIKDFYVSRRDTGGCREIVPFEFTWLVDIFGLPEPVACCRGKVSDLQVDIDDHYLNLVKFPSGPLASVTIEVLSRPLATREFRLIGSEGSVSFSGRRGVLEVNLAGSPAKFWIESLAQGDPAPGFIYPETPYVAEIRDFIAASTAGDASLFPNDFTQDAIVLGLLQDLEGISQ